MEARARRVPGDRATFEPLYPVARLLPAVIEEAENLRKGLLAEAEAARGQAQAIRAAACQKGWDEGRREGLAQVRELLDGLGRELARLRDELAEQITRIALSCAAHIVRGHVRADPQGIARIVADALEQARFCRQVTVIVHPRQLALLREACASVSRVGQSIDVRGDASCDVCDVRIETERGLIDASLAAQLEQLEEALLQEAKARE